jgi:predicted kinase
MPKCYQLVGVPGSGKTTWIQQQPWAAQCAIVSTDYYVEQEALRRGMTYSQVFNDYMLQAVTEMMLQARRAEAAGQDVIWDQTSTTRVARGKKFRTLPGYEHTAVVFKTPDPEELARRLALRPGKEIPQAVIDQMIRGFQMPTRSEGFVDIILVG